jgi:hypothetical protein
MTDDALVFNARSGFFFVVPRNVENWMFGSPQKLLGFANSDQEAEAYAD